MKDGLVKMNLLTITYEAMAVTRIVVSPEMKCKIFVVVTNYEGGQPVDRGPGISLSRQSRHITQDAWRINLMYSICTAKLIMSS